MQWSPQQDEALTKVDRWLKNPQDKQLFRLFGYAGTGKTTLARHLAEGVDGTVLFAAFTGKATSVLRSHGVFAQTIHSLIYHPKPRSAERLKELIAEQEGIQQMYYESRRENPPDWPGNPDWDKRLQQLKGEIQKEKENASRPDFSLNMESPLRDAALLVVDECSMVDETMATNLMSFGVPILVLGDPAQLPPVKGSGYFTNAEPDMLLTEIHRQARDNPIIELATLVRNGKVLPLGNYGASRVIERASPEMAQDADQVLVGRNRTRLSTNKRMRQLLGFTADLPQDGEKLVCLRNDNELGLLNGTLHRQRGDADLFEPWVHLRLTPDENPAAEPLMVRAHPEHFCGNPDDIGYWTRREAQEFTFGYALTVHKAQGSQWDKVLIINEADAFNGHTAKRWLYTAITRAAEEVTIVG
ncbi:MAG: hypothetical protein [Bacteriophage sp.]|nr:MAG: hypothetical protein [Bacteriophage sp.]